MFAAVVGQSWATAAHPYNLEINGVDRIASMQYPGMSIEMPGPGSNGSMTFTLEDPDASITVNEWDEVRFIEHAATRPILFGGFVQSVRYVAWAAAGRSLVVQCVGYGILLDRKVVPTYVEADDGSVTANVPFGATSLTNRHGGMVHAAAVWTSSYTGADDPDRGVTRAAYIWALKEGTGATFTGPGTLREALGFLVANGSWATGYFAPCGGSFWVDSAARLMLYPDVEQAYFFVPADANYLYADALPGVQIDTAGTYIVEGTEYERENTDRATSVYVSGGSAPGTGWVRATASERAGDLEEVATDPDSTSATAVTRLGMSVIGTRSAATARGTVTLGSSTPLAVWPGRHMDIANAQVGLTAAQDWRATSVRIDFRSATYRTYEIGFGGNVPAPSMANRSGRYATR